MLAGLIFATHDADDVPTRLAATLLVGGGTLLEFQARLLVSAGATQILVAVARVTPELLGAVNRIGRQGVAIDIVRSAAEATEKVHPLAHVMVMADGLMTSDTVVRDLAATSQETLLVTDEGGRLPGLERIDAETHWAGLALIAPRRLVDTAELPRDYDFESALLRIAAQAKLPRRLLTDRMVDAGHGIERDSHALHVRGRRIVSGLLAQRSSWVDRYVLAPVASAALPLLARHNVADVTVSAVGGVLGAIGLVALILGWPVAGLVFATFATFVLASGKVLCWLRGATRHARWQDAGIAGIGASAALLVGRLVSNDAGSAIGWVAAIALVAAAMMLERAADDERRRVWWPAPAAYPMLLLIFVIGGWPLAGLCAIAAYAAAALGQAIETLRTRV